MASGRWAPAGLAAVVLALLSCGTSSNAPRPTDALPIANRDAGVDRAPATNDAPMTVTDVGGPSPDQAPISETGGSTPTPADSAPADQSATPPASGPTVFYLGGQTQIGIYAFDGATGSLTEKSRVSMANRTSYLAASPDRKFLFASQGESPGHVFAFAINAQTGALDPINNVSTAGQTAAAGTSHVAVHPSGRWALTAHVASGRVAVLPIGAGGRAGQLGPPTDTRIFAVGAHQIIFDRSGKFVFVPVRDGQMVAQFVMNTEAGTLAPNTPPNVRSPAGSGPRHIAFHPTEQFAYVNNESNGTVTAYNHDAANGRLTIIDTVSSVPAGASERGTGHILVHPTGRFVYASNRFHGSIAAYTVNADTGRLTSVEFETGGGDIRFPRDFALTEDGRHLIVGNEQGDSMSVFTISPADGKLDKVGTPVPAPSGPQVVIAVKMTVP
jgi:6-phosphogluconolactonase